jgi:glycosyltransferase involved in cell wall biosynthesis
MSGTALVIPAWNEPDAIGPVLDEIPPESVDHVIVVVGSADDPTKTVADARNVQVLVQQGRGYGAACRTGVRAALQAGAGIVAFLDGDYSDPPQALPDVLYPITTGRADLVLGRRDLRLNRNALPPHARVGNAAVLWLIRMLYARTFHDLPSFKAIRADALQALDMREMTYGWTVEMVVKSARAGLRIEEVPILYRPRRGGRSKVSGSLRGSMGAAAGLVGCVLGHAFWQPASADAPPRVRGR